MRVWQTYSHFHLVRGELVGQGRGTSEGAAKRATAVIALANLRTNANFTAHGIVGV